MIKYAFWVLVPLAMFSCTTSGVEKEKDSGIISGTKENLLDADNKVIDQKKLEDGLKIEWYKKGTGENLKEGDLVMIDYKVRLKDGQVVDGNHLLKKESLPFLVGFQMQTKGWDIALKEMKVGDFARVLIPSDLARGVKGIEGLIPPNADNYLIIRILEKRNPDRIVDGNKVWLLEENKRNKLKFNEKTAITIHSMVSTPTNPIYFNTFRENQPFTFRVQDNGIIPGLKKALINAKKSDRLYIVVPPSEAYGAKGYLDIVKPNESLFYNVLVMDVAKL